MKPNVLLLKFYEALDACPRRDMDFGVICRKAGLNKEKTDRCLRDSLGFSGEEIVKSFKFDLPALYFLR